MLITGHDAPEGINNEALRYWRTRFIVIPTAEPPMTNTGPSGETLNDEEIRLLGMDKLAELFTKVRWQRPDQRGTPVTPVRILPTTLLPAMSVRDESLMSQLDEVHASGPLHKKMKSDREIADMSLSAIAKAMKEEDSVSIKTYHWHRSTYQDSFTGYDFTSWLVREFGDVSTRAEAAEWGVRLEAQGLFSHCRGTHGFLDGYVPSYVNDRALISNQALLLSLAARVHCTLDTQALVLAWFRR